MDDATFQEVFDWLAERNGKPALIEVGTSDPRARDTDFIVLVLHTTLGPVRDITGALDGRRALALVIGGDGDGDRSRIEIDEASLESALIHRSGVLKVWQHGVYLGLSSGPAPT